VPETIQFSDCVLEKMYSISLKGLRLQFSKKIDAGNIEVPEFSSSSPTTPRNFAPSNSKLLYFYDKNKTFL